MSEHAKIKPSHLSRIAIVYVRQSSAAQVEHNRESTARQYGLTQRAAALGWNADRVTVINEEQAPHLLEMMRQNDSGLTIVESKDPANELLSGSIDAVIELPRGAERDALAGKENAIAVGQWWAEALRPVAGQLKQPLAQIMHDVKRHESERSLARDLLANYGFLPPQPRGGAPH